MGKCSFRAHTLEKKKEKEETARARSDTRAFTRFFFFFPFFPRFSPRFFPPRVFRNPAGGSTIANGSHFPLSHGRDTRRFPSCCSPFSLSLSLSLRLSVSHCLHIRPCVESSTRSNREISPPALRYISGRISLGSNRVPWEIETTFCRFYCGPEFLSSRQLKSRVRFSFYNRRDARLRVFWDKWELQLPCLKISAVKVFVLNN